MEVFEVNFKDLDGISAAAGGTHHIAQQTHVLLADMCRCGISLIPEVINVEVSKQYCEYLAYESWCL